MRKLLILFVAALFVVTTALFAACGGGGEKGATPTAGVSIPSPAAGSPVAGAPAPAPEPGGGVPDEVQRQALQLVSEREGLDVEKLYVASATADYYPVSGKRSYSFKIVNGGTGNAYLISLDEGGQEVDGEQMLADEEAAYQQKYGKLEVALYEQLQTAPPDEPINVIIRLEEPPYTPPERPETTKGVSTDEVNAYITRALEERATAVEAVTKPFLEQLDKMGQKAEADKYTPMLSASLLPSAIEEVEKLPEVNRVYQSPIAESFVDVARQTVAANTVEGRGMTGSGIKVGEIECGGQINTSNPNLAGVVQDTTYSCVYPHAAAVAGIIRSTNDTIRGVAPNVSLWIGGSCHPYGGSVYGDGSELQNRASAAATWGARLFNHSWGSNNSGNLNANDIYFDDMIPNLGVTMVASAGNAGGQSDWVGSPGAAYNIVAVGASDDKNTTSWGDDTMASYSSWKDPVSTHGDREKPEVTGPGTNFQSTTNASPWTGDVGSGTSYSGPVVTGIAALMMERDYMLTTWPEAVKAILMATAMHDIGANEYDGAGEVCADLADDVARGVGGDWGGTAYGCASTPEEFDAATISLVAGKPARVAIVWDTDTAYSDYANRPCADLDLKVIDPSGSTVATSSSFDNTYEWVQFTPSQSGSYKIRVKRWRCDMDPKYLAWAWWQGDQPAGPTPAATTTPTTTPTPTRTPTSAPTLTPTRTPTPGATKTPTRTPRPARPTSTGIHPI